MNVRALRGATARWWFASSVLTIAGLSAAQSENLVANPYFHDNVLGWEGSPAFPDPTWFGDTDEGSCAGSGVAKMLTEAAGQYFRGYIAQCIVLPPPVPATTHLSARLFFNTTGTSLEVRVWYFESIDCTTGFLDTVVDYWSEGLGLWSDLSMSFPTSAGANSVKLDLTSIYQSEHEFLLDSVYFGYENPILLDGFEGNAGGESHPCRWVSP